MQEFLKLAGNQNGAWGSGGVCSGCDFQTHLKCTKLESPGVGS